MKIEAESSSAGEQLTRNRSLDDEIIRFRLGFFKFNLFIYSTFQIPL